MSPSKQERDLGGGRFCDFTQVISYHCISIFVVSVRFFSQSFGPFSKFFCPLSFLFGFFFSLNLFSLFRLLPCISLASLFQFPIQQSVSQSTLLRLFEWLRIILPYICRFSSLPNSFISFIHCVFYIFKIIFCVNHLQSLLPFPLMQS